MPLQHLPQGLGRRTLAVPGHGHELRAGRPEDVDGAGIRRLLHRHHVARIDERPRDQVEALLRAVDHQDVVGARLDAEPEEVGRQVRAEGQVSVAARRVLEERRALRPDDLVQHPPERVRREEPAVGRALGEGDQGPGPAGQGGPALGPRAADVGAPREQAGPVQGNAARRGGHGAAPAGRRRRDERPLPHMGPRPARGHQLLVRERDGRPVDAERLGQLAGGRKLHAGNQPRLADQPLDLLLDLPGQRHGALAVQLEAERHTSHLASTLDVVNRQLASPVACHSGQAALPGIAGPARRNVEGPAPAGVL